MKCHCCCGTAPTWVIARARRSRPQKILLEEKRRKEGIKIVVFILEKASDASSPELLNF
jgi:hypothetical protein